MIKCKSKNDVDLWVSCCYDCEPNLGGYYCEISVDEDGERVIDDFTVPSHVVDNNRDDEFIKEYIAEYTADVVYEYCPHCESEQVLIAEKEPQLCLDCGKMICPCSLCENCERNCELERRCNELNRLNA